MSTTSSDASPAISVPPATPPRRKVGSAWVVTGLSLGGCAALSLMWRTEVQRAAYWQSQVAPLKAEAARYRIGLQEEIARTMRLAEELKSKKDGAVSVR
jgi:hypothetical protein